MKKQKNIRVLCHCAILLALSVVLSLIRFSLPFGGAVTLLSMLPLCLVSIRFGIGWGVGTAFCFSLFQVLQGEVFAWGLTPKMLVASLLLDYLLAFSVLGFAGIFRKRGRGGILLGISSVCLLRFFIHFLSGIILWANYAEFVAFGVTWVDHPVLYSLCYNGTYMLPETLLTLLACFLFSKVPQFQRFLGISEKDSEMLDKS